VKTLCFWPLGFSPGSLSSAEFDWAARCLFSDAKKLASHKRARQHCFVLDLKNPQFGGSGLLILCGT
jgi:hypothetical protein